MDWRISLETSVSHVVSSGQETDTPTLLLQGPSPIIGEDDRPGETGTAGPQSGASPDDEWDEELSRVPGVSPDQSGDHSVREPPSHLR